MTSTSDRTPVSQLVAEPAEVRRYVRRQPGIDDRRGESLELPELCDNLVGGRDRQIGERLGE
jgi:hypothetical protein